MTPTQIPTGRLKSARVLSRVDAAFIVDSRRPKAAVGKRRQSADDARPQQFPVHHQGRPTDAERVPVAEFASVTPEYFRTLEIPLISGRNFTDADIVVSPTRRTDRRNACPPLLAGRRSRRKTIQRRPAHRALDNHCRCGRNDQVGWLRRACHASRLLPALSKPNVTGAIYLRTREIPGRWVT